jgi:hypothetical protein
MARPHTIFSCYSPSTAGRLALSPRRSCFDSPGARCDGAIRPTLPPVQRTMPAANGSRRVVPNCVAVAKDQFRQPAPSRPDNGHSVTRRASGIGAGCHGVGLRRSFHLYSALARADVTKAGGEVLPRVHSPVEFDDRDLDSVSSTYDLTGGACVSCAVLGMAAWVHLLPSLEAWLPLFPKLAVRVPLPEPAASVHPEQAIDQSLASGTNALALAERLGHPFTLGITLLQSTVLHQLRREPGMVLQQVHAAEVLAAEQRPSLHIDFRVLRGGALAAQGALTDAVAVTREGLSERNRAGAKLYRPFCLAVFAEALEGAGEHDHALAALSEAMAVIQETGERWWEAKIHRLRGVSLLSRNCLPESEASFQHSIGIAQAQQAKSLELRATASLARLWGEQGRRVEARDLLAPVYGWFEEGFDTEDLKEAKTLIDELA